MLEHSNNGSSQGESVGQKKNKHRRSGAVVVVGRSWNKTSHPTMAMISKASAAAETKSRVKWRATVRSDLSRCAGNQSRLCAAKGGRLHSLDRVFFFRRRRRLSISRATPASRRPWPHPHPRPAHPSRPATWSLPLPVALENEKTLADQTEPNNCQSIHLKKLGKLSNTH